MAKESFVKGAAILGAAGLIVKFLGAAFQIPLGNMIHDTGMAYYGPAYYIYTLFLIISTSALPVAISKMVSERAAVGDFRGAHRVHHVAVGLMIAIGVVSFIIVTIFSGQLAHLTGYDQARLAIISISPALIIVPVMAAYRGYFQGLQNMRPTAVSQIVEQVFRVIIGLGMAYILYHHPKTGDLFDAFDKFGQGAAGATFGATAGSMAGLLAVALIYMASRKAIKARVRRTVTDVKESASAIMAKLMRIAVPITLGASIMPIMNILDAIIIKRRLMSAGFGADTATSLYGQLSGFVMPLINFPQVLTAALAMSLVPFISAAFSRKDTEALRSNTKLALRVALIVGYPCAFGLAVLSHPIMLLLFSYGGKASAISAGNILSVMAFGVIFLSIVQTLTGILQGVGKQDVPVINMMIGIGVKVVLTWILTGTTLLNIKGAALATVIAYIVVTVLDIKATTKYIGIRFDWITTAVRPLIATLAMSAVAIGVYYLVNLFAGYQFACLLGIACAVVVYVLMLFVTGSVTREDLEQIPHGGKLIKLMDIFARK